MPVRVTVDIDSSEGELETVGVLEIGIRNPSERICDYDYRFGRADERGTKIVFEPWFILRRFDRERRIWALIAQIVARRAAGHEESSDYSSD
jgi:hypothetical protein